MGAPSDLTAEQWAEVREAAIAGVSYPELAAKFGVEANTISQKAWYDEWPTPARLLKLKTLYQTKPIDNGGNLTNPKNTPTSTEILVSTSLENGQKGTFLASKLMLHKLEKAADNPDSLADLKTPQDVKMAMATVRIAAGMDREGTEVKVNLAMFQGEVAQAGQDQGMCWEVEQDGGAET